MQWITPANVTIYNNLIYHLSRNEHTFKIDFMNDRAGINMAALVTLFSLQSASEYSMYAFI